MDPNDRTQYVQELVRLYHRLTEKSCSSANKWSLSNTNCLKLLHLMTQSTFSMNRAVVNAISEIRLSGWYGCTTGSVVISRKYPTSSIDQQCLVAPQPRIAGLRPDSSPCLQLNTRSLQWNAGASPIG